MAEVRAAKHLGQHFLIDDNVISRMVACLALQESDHIIEIGPGLGALTLPVLNSVKQMSAIEFDHRVLAPLSAKAAAIGQLNLIEADVLTVQFSDIAAAPIRLIGNLPYNLSSPILFHCLAQRQNIADMHFMLQKEVVERICAEPGGKDYGRLSIMLQQHLDTENLFDIPPDAFEPPPKVDSAVVRLTPLAQPRWQVDDEMIFEKIVRITFSQRRKMLRKSLSQWFTSSQLEALEIAPTARPETLSGGEFAVIANALKGKWNNE